MRRNDFIHNVILYHLAGRSGNQSSSPASLVDRAVEYADEIERVAPFDPEDYQETRPVHVSVNGHGNVAINALGTVSPHGN